MNGRNKVVVILPDEKVLPRLRSSSYQLVRGDEMVSKAREYIDFWVENSVHATEEYRAPGGSQDVTELVHRLVEGAKAQGITEQSMHDEVGDLAEYVRARLKAANAAENSRRNR
jgi:hypothetical protein